jgi:hypothetical protein
MRIDHSGNINIGTTGEAYKSYVNGTSYFNNTTIVDGQSSTTGDFTNSSTSYYMLEDLE